MVNGSKIYRDVLWRPDNENVREINPVKSRIIEINKNPFSYILYVFVYYS